MGTFDFPVPCLSLIASEIATKESLRNLTRTLALELADNINVNNIAPGMKEEVSLSCARERASRFLNSHGGIN